MIVTWIEIRIDPVPDKPSDKDMTAKAIIFDHTAWRLPSPMFPRDVRFLSALQELIDSYNKGRDY